MTPYSETTARQSIEAALERLGEDRDDCWLDHPGPKDTVIDMSDKKTWDMKVGALDQLYALSLTPVVASEPRVGKIAWL